MKESKRTTNVVTALKVGVVLFMIVGGFSLYSTENLTPYTSPHGLPGVLQGATTSFFGYLGYDEVCCVAGEAIDPTRNVPRAVMATIVGAAVLYFFASMALTGMQVSIVQGGATVSFVAANIKTPPATSTTSHTTSSTKTAASPQPSTTTAPWCPPTSPPSGSSRPSR